MTAWVGFTPGFQPEIVPSLVQNRKTPACKEQAESQLNRCA